MDTQGKQWNTITKGPAGNHKLACYFLFPNGNFASSYTDDLNPLITNNTIWCRLTLAACYQLSQSVFKKGGIGKGRRVSARGAVHLAAPLAGNRTALVGTG